MEFADYQQEVRKTDQRPGEHEEDLVIHLLGLTGQAGSAAAVLSKRMRDGDAYGGWRKQMREELGDVLWYLATIANKLDLDLADIARANLHKTQNRWLPTPNYQLDAGAPEGERLPRRGIYSFHQTTNSDGRLEVTVHFDGRQIGDPLTDNALNDDGYRFHDVFHLAYATVLGWSPLTRALLKRKRKSVVDIDEAEDGGRGIVIEEGVAAFAFAYGALHNDLGGITRVDQPFLDSIAMMTSNLEVGVRSAADWESAIVQGYAMFRELVAHGGGSVSFDADDRTLRYIPPGAL